MRSPCCLCLCIRPKPLNAGIVEPEEIFVSVCILLSLLGRSFVKKFRILKQEVVGRTKCLFSFDTTGTA
jgi:hypothetical protein